MVNEANTNMKLKIFRLKTVNKMIIAHLNINSLREYFELLNSKIKDDIDALMISKTKLDERIPTNQFMRNSFSVLFRIDRNDGDGGIIRYIREDIPSRLHSV